MKYVANAAAVLLEVVTTCQDRTTRIAFVRERMGDISYKVWWVRLLGRGPLSFGVLLIVLAPKADSKETEAANPRPR